MWERRPWGRKPRERRRVPWPPRQDQGLAEETWTESEAAGAGDVASPFSSGLEVSGPPDRVFVVGALAGRKQYAIEDHEPRSEWRVCAGTGRSHRAGR